MNPQSICPKCAGQARAHWVSKGGLQDIDGHVELGAFGAVAGSAGTRRVAVHECIHWTCQCGYSWLGATAKAQAWRPLPSHSDEIKTQGRGI